ncbi:MAG: hypothetical protein J3Q66DRAFT_398973 [Benniella sp.]|nr:MAG: hypothetical protein J3Q66DRAFT_398973 [Benniella sp.]
MIHSIPSSVTFTVLTLTLNLLFPPSLIPTVAAQDFRPQPNSETCNAYAEGQGLYILGGTTKENFMLDLSVSWNASEPVFKKLPGGPSVDIGACAMTNNGDDLFVLTKGTGYVYNVKSSTWSVFHNANFGATGKGQAATSDPKTGFIYLPTYGMNFAGEKVLVSLDLKSNTVNTTAVGVDPQWYQLAIWSTFLKSIVIMDQHRNPFTFTPSIVSNPDKGWGKLELTSPEFPGTYIANSWNCGAAAYNGTKLIHIGRTLGGITSVYIMDVVKRTWMRGPIAPSLFYSACAVTGDQFIVWGGDFYDGPETNKTYAFNMKTEKWVSRYIAPPPRSTTTTFASQTPTQPIPSTTAISVPGNTSSNDMKLVTIIVIVTGTLMAIILGSIFRYHKRTRQFNSCDQRTNPDGPSTDSLDIKDDPNISVKDLSKGSSRRRDPSDSGSHSIDHHGQRKWHMNGLLGRIHQGSLGARPLSEHPHAAVEDPATKRNVQEGALEVQILSQHPHAVVGETFNSNNGDKAMRGYIGGYGDKEELEDQ